MTDEKKRLTSMVLTPSGREFMRGGENKFGSVVNKGSLQKNMFKNFTNVMAGTETAISMLEEKENEGKNCEGESNGKRVFAKIWLPSMASHYCWKWY